ncbi:MAG TPA: hypothetical protein VFQ22_10360, partial [Longimicrobiales bacterium]|nr:hypothetical protein [Longimicrobiales bacterium]
MPALRGLSLRQTLPLLVFGLTAGALLIGGTLAYLEVRGAAIAAAEARLTSVAQQLAAQAAANQATQIALEERVAASPEVRAALRGLAFDSARLGTLLDSLRSGSSEGLPVTLLRPDGTVAFRIGSLPARTDPDATPPLRSTRALGFFRTVGDQILYWSTMPVRASGGDPIGWIAQRRRIGNPEVAGNVVLMLGTEARLLVGQLSDSAWVDITGSIVVAPGEDIELGEPFALRVGSNASLAVAAPIGGTPWIVL